MSGVKIKVKKQNHLADCHFKVGKGKKIRFVCGA